jgi:hypothetical protein
MLPVLLLKVRGRFRMAQSAAARAGPVPLLLAWIGVGRSTHVAAEPIRVGIVGRELQARAGHHPSQPEADSEAGPRPLHWQVKVPKVHSGCSESKSRGDHRAGF